MKEIPLEWGPDPAAPGKNRLFDRRMPGARVLQGINRWWRLDLAEAYKVVRRGEIPYRRPPLEVRMVKSHLNYTQRLLERFLPSEFLEAKRRAEK